MGDTLTDMAYLPIVFNGAPPRQSSIREIYEDTVGQANVSVDVDTGIAISARQRSRVRGMLVVSSVAGGVPVITAVASIYNGHLRVTIANATVGTTFKGLLDVELTQSSQQHSSAQAAVIAIVYGTLGAIAPIPLSQTLFQTYNYGGATADQTMVIANAKGGGVIVDASASGDPTVASVVTLEVRQNDLDIPLPLLLSRRGNFANPAQLVFQKARGTFTPDAASDVQANDLLGCIDFFGQLGGPPQTIGAQIIASVTSVTRGLDVQLEFWTSLSGTSTKLVTMGIPTGATPVTVFFEVNHLVVPNVTHTGHLGSLTSVRVWGEISGYDVNVMANVQMGGVAAIGGANLTIALPNANPAGPTVMPAPLADQVYLGALDWTGSGGGGGAALAISSEEIVVPTGGQPDTLIPITFNGVPYYLLAINKGGT